MQREYQIHNANSIFNKMNSIELIYFSTEVHGKKYKEGIRITNNKTRMCVPPTLSEEKCGYCEVRYFTT